MRFSTPTNIPFEIPDDWWTFTEMDKFVRTTDYYLYPPEHSGIQIKSLAEIEPPTRSAGIPPFRKYKLIPLLLAFQSPAECVLPPIQVLGMDSPPCRFKVYNGFHRYYASVAAGYTHIPVVVIEIPA
jgi:hypothetical protein